MTKAQRGGNIAHASGKINTIPNHRQDGEMYARPEPDPFHPDWLDGFDDGLADSPRDSSLRKKPAYYSDGYKCGQEEKRNLDKQGSSNA